MRNSYNPNPNYQPYNNTIANNRSFSSNKYSLPRNQNLYLNTNENNSNNRYNNNNNNRINYTPNSQRYNNSQIWDKTRGPYGVRFDEMDKHNRIGQKQYRDDLEYLMSLKNGRHGDMTQKEWEAYNRKLHYMNDVSINIFLINIKNFYLLKFFFYENFR